MPADLSALLEGGKLTDVTISLSGNKKIHVHRAILGARSEVFAAMFEHDTKEKADGRIRLPELDYRVGELMVRYIYSGTIEEAKLEQYAEELIVVADKYALDHLKLLCERNLVARIDAQTAPRFLRLADLYSAETLHQMSLDFIGR